MAFTVLLNKGKGSRNGCNSYREITLLVLANETQKVTTLKMQTSYGVNRLSERKKDGRHNT